MPGADVAAVNVVNFYLDEKQATQVKALSGKGKLDESDRAAMQGFVLEALRE